MTQERCDLLKPYLDQYKRRFTIIDLGAGITPMVSWWISKNYDAVVVIVERDPIQWKREEFGPNVIWLQTDVSAEDLTLLSECEHFDVVLAFNFLHHFPKDEYQKAAIAVAGLGTDIFIQVPSTEEDEKTPGFGLVINELNGYCMLMGEKIGDTVQFPQHRTRPIYYLQPRPQTLRRTHLEAPDNSADTLIADNYEGVQCRIKGKNWKDWIPGINLWNFCLLHGVWPDKSTILKLLFNFKLPLVNHGDVTPWNFVMDGSQLYLVDGFEGWEFDDKENLKSTITLVEEKL